MGGDVSGGSRRAAAWRRAAAGLARRAARVLAAALADGPAGVLPHRPLRGPDIRFLAREPLLARADWDALIARAPFEALRHAHAMAAAGNPMAQVMLARMLLAGKAGPRDPDAAFAWISRAAQGGQREALNMLGRCHELGWGVRPSSAAAAPLYRAAAELGDPWAQFNLANLLFDGQGVAQDREQALLWHLRAARQGHAKAMNMVGRYCEEGWRGRRRPAAAHWYRRAAHGGDFRGQYNHARLLHWAGRRDEAVFWLTRAIAQGIPIFCRNAAPDLCASPDPDLSALGLRALERACESGEASDLEALRRERTRRRTSTPPARFPAAAEAASARP